MHQASQLLSLEKLLNLAKWQLNCIVFGAVRYHPYPLDAQRSHEILSLSRLMSGQIVHHNGNLVIFIDSFEFPEVGLEDHRINRTVV